MNIVRGALAALAFSVPVSAMAADLPARMPVKAPVMAPVAYGWTGFYIGGNGGYSWGRSRSDVSFVNSLTGVPIVPPAGSVNSNSFNLDGFVAGGQAGYNWQVSSWVFGLETDLQWSNEKGTANFTCAPVAVVGGVCLPGATFLPTTFTGTNVTVDQKIQWFGTFRARAGVLFAPSVLAYVTGGLAYGNVKTDMGIQSTIANTLAGTPAFATSSASSLRAGWTVGGGIEAMFDTNWSAKLEYLYVDLGTFNSSVGLVAPTIGANFSSRVTDNVFRAGINYRFAPGPVVARY